MSTRTIIFLFSGPSGIWVMLWQNSGPETDDPRTFPCEQIDVYVLLYPVLLV
jgi:hypothetical protein